MRPPCTLKFTTTPHPALLHCTSPDGRARVQRCRCSLSTCSTPSCSARSTSPSRAPPATTAAPTSTPPSPSPPFSQASRPSFRPSSSSPPRYTHPPPQTHHPPHNHSQCLERRHTRSLCRRSSMKLVPHLCPTVASMQCMRVNHTPPPYKAKGVVAALLLLRSCLGRTRPLSGMESQCRVRFPTCIHLSPPKPPPTPVMPPVRLCGPVVTAATRESTRRSAPPAP